MAREGGLPRTLAVVVYNGGERWTAIGEESHLAEVPSELAERDLALLQPQFYRLIDTGGGTEHGWPDDNLVAVTARMQHSATAHELLARLLAETRRLPGPAWQAFRQALHAWAKALWIDKMGAEAAFQSFEELEQEEREMATALQARWAQYDADLRAEGRELGLAQGRELGRADERNRLLRRQATLIRRQATLKFGRGTAERLADRLADLTTLDDLDRVGDWIIECESGDELLSRLRSITVA